MRCAGATALLAVAVLALPLSAAAQRTTGEIIGKVIDESGAVLPGVTVTLRGAGVAGAPTVVTSETGTYRFPVLPPGTYDLEYPLGGFATLKRTGDPGLRRRDRRAGDHADGRRASARRSPSQGEAPVVNPRLRGSEHDLQPRMGAERAGRRFSYFDLINSAPGVSATSNVGQSTSAQSLGSSTNENSYQIDGTDISSTPWLNTDADRGSRSAAARRVGGIRQRAGRRLQHRHAPGRQRFPRRRQRLLSERRADRPQHDRRGRQRLPVSPRHLARRHGAGVRPVHAATSSGSSARCSISATTTRSRASIPTTRRRTTRGACSGSSTTTSTRTTG